MELLIAGPIVLVYLVVALGFSIWAYGKVSDKRGEIAGIVVMLQFACTVRAETPGERFDKFINAWTKKCTTLKLRPGETTCDILKLKPADPLATPEGRFAHSIKIPNPVPEDSGYRPGMTSWEYFDHLCKTEAGEFIYKTVGNVEGVYMMRPRKRATDYELEHLYVLEDPYGEVSGDHHNPAERFVQPYLGKYRFLELPARNAEVRGAVTNYHRYYRDENLRPRRDYQTALNGKAVFVRYIVAEKETYSLRSQYGFTWRGLTRQRDREMGIAGSELLILDLRTNEVLAVRRGFIRSGGVHNSRSGVWWLVGQTCPRISQKRNHQFIQEVLRPVDSTKGEN